MLRDAERSEESQRAQEHDAMLREAMSRPGVREIMEVYKHAERRVGLWSTPYWALARRMGGPTVTDHTNPDPPVRAAHAHLE